MPREVTFMEDDSVPEAKTLPNNSALKLHDSKLLPKPKSKVKNGFMNFADSDYSVGKYHLQTEALKHATAKLGSVRLHAKYLDNGRFGANPFLKYSMPRAADADLLMKGRKKTTKLRFTRWPYDYHPNICQHIVQNELQLTLNKIFQPRQWKAQAGPGIGAAEAPPIEWKQTVSVIPGTRMDVIDLKENLDELLQKRSTKVFGLCSDRIDLYLQCFDELIRQVTIGCTERGLMMATVRDTLKSMLHSYHTLYESSCALVLRKTLNHEEEIGRLNASITEVMAERQRVQEQLAEMDKKIESVKQMYIGHTEKEYKKHVDRMMLLRKTNDQLRNALHNTVEFGPRKKKSIVSAKKASVNKKSLTKKV